MKLRVERMMCGATCTIGEVTVDGQFECFSLEDCVREISGRPTAEWKLRGDTAIPRGLYGVSITPSVRFKRDLPILEGVEGFSGVRIHPGNTHEDTEGCILVGKSHTDKTVTESRAAFNALFSKIQQALQDGDEVTIEVA